MTDHDPSGADHDREREERDLVAAELAIGLRRARAGDLDAPDVQAWTARLTPLLVEAPSIPPGADVWPRIATRIAPSVSTPARQSGSIWRSLPFWRSLAFGGIGLTAASLVVLFGATDVLLRPQTPPRQQLVAVIGPSDVSALFTAVYDPSRSELSVAPIAGAVRDSRVPELWYVPAGGKPRSLGVFDPTQKVEVRIPEAIVQTLRPQDALAISLEPAGGSPTGSPTGPVIAQGVIRPL